jgi:transaldolase
LPRGLSAKEVFLELACADVADACDVLRPVWKQTDGRDGYVSIEVDPTLAYDSLAQYEEAKRLHERIARPNLLVKIPGTKPGLAAIEDAIAGGHSINVTLVFSVERYVAVARAYLEGLGRFQAAGGDVSTVRSVASFFVSRIDTETDRRLDVLGAPAELMGKLGIANAKLAYERFRQLFSPRNDVWAALAAAGAHPQRCLWASTSTKNPAYRDVLYVEELIGPHTVITMPETTLLAFQDHGTVAATLERGLDKAHRLLDRLKAVGIDYDDVVQTLEADGIEKFAHSVSQLYAELDAKREALLARPGKPR